MPKLSIVIPVFNVENYLCQCLDSLLEQTLEDIEIICVYEDEITGSLDILARYAQKDKRIRLLCQTERGLNEAREQGYLLSEGEYLTFVDADDWVEKDIYRSVVEEMDKSGADGAVFNWYVNTDSEQKSSSKTRLEGIVSDRDTLHKVSVAGICSRYNPYADNRYEGWLWDKVYRKSFFDRVYTEGILFPRVRHWEDAYQNILLFDFARSIYFTNEYGYHYRKGNAQSGSARYRGSLPARSDFEYYQSFEKRYAGESYYTEAMNTMIINLFWNYVSAHYYFHPANPMPLWKQLREVRALLHADYEGGCYFPIKDALGGGQN